MSKEKEFYILSTKYSIRERHNKSGKVYDIRFRIVDKITGCERQKEICGFKSKREAATGYTDFVTAHCDLLRGNLLQVTRLSDKNKQPSISTQTATDVNNPSKRLWQYCRDYFNAMQNQLKASTIYDKVHIIKLMVEPTLGNCTLTQLDRTTLLKWQDELWSKKNPKTSDYYSYQYLSRCRAYLSAVLTFIADRSNGNFKNYLLEIKRPKRRSPKTPMQFYTRTQFDQFLQVCDNILYKTLIATLFFTGRRKGEVLSLSPKDVDMQLQRIAFNKTITRKTLLPQPYIITSTKTEKTAFSQIPQTLYDLLQEYIASPYYNTNSQFFFGGNAPISDNTLRRAFNHYTALANLPPIRIHDLRHSFVSMCIHLGATLTAIAELIGDTLTQVTKTYAHLYTDDVTNLIDKIH